MKVDGRINNYEIQQHPSKTAARTHGGQTPVDGQEINEKKPAGQDAIVNISQAAKEVRLVREIIESTPAVREEKVAEIREKIESGNYRIDHQAVADKMLDAFLDDTF